MVGTVSNTGNLSILREVINEVATQFGVDLVATGGAPTELHHRPAMGLVHVLEAVVGDLRIADQITHLLVQRGLVALDREVSAPVQY